NTYYLCIKENGVTFEHDPDDESCSLQFKDMKTVIGAPTHHSWKARAPSPYPRSEIVGTGVGGRGYIVIYAWGSSASYDIQHSEDTYGYLAAVGGARITITRK